MFSLLLKDLNFLLLLYGPVNTTRLLNLIFEKVVTSLSINSRRDSPVRGQIYLLKIASIYGNFTPIGGGVKWLFLGIFLKLSLCKRLLIIP